MAFELVDSFNRKIDYLRLSVTDRCNLRCFYCMPKKGIKLLKRDQLLTFEEIIRATKILSGIGIKKVRLTGGEPLVRDNILSLIKNIGMVDGIEDISLTTNGLLLNGYLPQLSRIGVGRLNISLDSLNPEKYKTITRGGCINKVIDGINKAMDIGFKSIKINVVITSIINKDDIIDFIKFSIEKELSIRFIEMMPIKGLENVECNRIIRNDPNSILGMDNILSIMDMFGVYEKVEAKDGYGPAIYYKFIGNKGKIGFISNHKSVCHSCNRIRLTPYGAFKLCLFSPLELNIK
ncbi:MAG: GTP 3',8-cyclase MoaA, partial [Actinobacteria bacterium]|nr:GTP 3',8-cyclase MoaA [Actinomycetota bacterium]